MTETATLHTDAPAPSETPQLIDKVRAAKILGHRGTRRVLQLVAAGKLEGVKQRVDGSSQVKVMFRLDDVKRFKAERDKPKPIDVSPKSDPAADHHPAERGVAKSGLRELAVLLEAVGARSREEAKPAKQWLTVDEAAEYCGLPASTLLRSIEKFAATGQGGLPALNVGPRPGGRWRVKRSDVDALQVPRKIPVAEEPDSKDAARFNDDFPFVHT